MSTLLATGSPWLFLLSLGASAGLLALALGLSMSTRRTAPVQVTDLEPDPAPVLWRSLWWLVQWLAPACRRLMPIAWQVRLGTQLREAGLELALTPAQYVAGRLLFALLAALLAAVSSPAGWHTTSATMCGLVVWLLPAARLKGQIDLRRARMTRELPVMLDLIGLSVQAGSTMSAALAMAVERGPAGPMRDELARVMREIRAGRARHEALRAMGDRFEFAGLRHAVAAMITAEKQGADLSPVLRAQAIQRREERFIDAERRAMQAPVKLLLPLVVFIFPGTFLILLFPVAMQVLADGLLQ